MLNKELKSLLDSRNALAQEITEEGVKLLEAKAEIDGNHKDDCPCVLKTGDCTDISFQEKMGEVETRITAQKEKRSRVEELDKLIFAAEGIEQREIKSLERLQKPVTEQSMVQVAADALANRKKVGLYDQIAGDFQSFLQKIGLTRKSDFEGRPVIGISELKTGEQFNTLASFHIAFGTTPTESGVAAKSVLTDLGVQGDELTKVETALKSRRDASFKSMFTQHPLAGGEGDLFAPDQVFAGNTGGLCEYIIDDTIDVLPYPKVSFLDCIPVRRIPKSYVVYVRQTIRVNNASAVGEGVTLGIDNPQTPGVAVDFRPLKPESEFGWTQGKAYTLTFADTIPVSEEFLEDCPAIADAVENQLMENVRQEFYDQIINGDGSDGEFPELIGLLAQVGLSTRVHQGAASFMGTAQGAGAVTDNIRETIVRAIFDAESFGYNVDCVLMSHEDYVQMYFLKDGDDRPLYTDAELDSIRGAKVRADVRMPAGTALVGAFRQVVQILIRRAIRLDIGWVDKQFRQDMLTLRATLRGGVLVRAPHALIRVTGI